ncbi:MAG: hypothetical protein HXL67_07200 [Cloacibacterium normanense]|nr:hypothetical protein [Cloacibacterium normanense]HCO20453.1 hypothetical protein [Flavobacteriaceae bacterium]
MKRHFIIFLLVITAQLLKSQYYSSPPKRSNNDIQTLEKLYGMMEREKTNETKAMQLVFSYRNEVKSEIRRNSKNLSEESYNYLIKKEKDLWENSILYSIKNYYNGNYSSYLTKNINSLEYYKELMLDSLYKHLQK